ncbi:MAG TPA: RagB/SusD family nutrient uptake outer membrane protein [Puia sp.]|jgi:hypothetical protein
MQRLYKLPFIPLLLLLAFAGCKKFVDIAPPQSSITTSQIFATDAQGASAMAGIYSQMMSNNGASTWSNGTLALDAGLSSDEIAGFQGALSSGVTPFEKGTLSSVDGLADGSFWTPIYKIVGNVNSIIDGVNASTTLTDSARKELLGEAKFIRAFCYFYLTNLYGDVPLPLSSDFNKTALLPRTVQGDVYKQIIQDLTDAQAALPDNYLAGRGERIYPTRFAATAMLARAYLYIQDWKDADAQASSLVANNQFSLPSDLTQVFLKNSSESIWQLQPNTTVSPYGPYDYKNFTPILIWKQVVPPGDSSLFDPSIYPDYSSLVTPLYYLNKTINAEFERGDRRKDAWTGFTPTPHYAPYTGDTLFYPLKYINVRSGQPATQYYMVLRLAEQYLIRAEAKAEEGDLPGAAADLNVIRARAGLPPTTASGQADLLAAILKERRMELFAEWGHRFLDLKRTGQANAVIGALPIKQPWHGYELLYPISQYDLQTDPNLTQNSGY